MTPAEEFRATAGRFGALVEGAEDWDVPTPVAEWTARDVVRHLVEWFPAFLQGGAGIALPTGPSVDDDPVGAWCAFQAGVQAMLDDPATADRVLSNPHIGDLPVPQATSQFFTADVFMHTWDLARATGQPTGLDPEACEQVLAGMEPLDAMLRQSGQCGPRVAVRDDAAAEDRLAAFVGRDPYWSPPTLQA